MKQHVAGSQLSTECNLPCGTEAKTSTTPGEVVATACAAHWKKDGSWQATTHWPAKQQPPAFKGEEPAPPLQHDPTGLLQHGTNVSGGRAHRAATGQHNSWSRHILTLNAARCAVKSPGLICSCSLARCMQSSRAPTRSRAAVRCVMLTELCFKPAVAMSFCQVASWLYAEVKRAVRRDSSYAMVFLRLVG